MNDAERQFYKQLGHRIAVRRAILGLSRQAVLDRMREHGAGIRHPNIILKWETAETRLPLVNLLLLALALETTVPKLVPIDALPCNTLRLTGIWDTVC